MCPQSVEQTYLSSSCNRTAHSVDWSNSGLICFASCNNVVIYNFNLKSGGGGNVVQVLTGHSKRVNAVRWVKGNSSKLQLVSVSSDLTAILWTQDENGFFKKTFDLKGHTDILTVVDAISVTTKNETSSLEKLFIITAANDSKIKVWTSSTTLEWNCQSIDLRNGLCISAGLTCLPGSQKIILACSIDDCRIHIYASSNENSDEVSFSEVEVLVGHEDWVQSLDFTLDVVHGHLLLASGSQDTTVRLWRFAPQVLETSFTKTDELKTEEKIISLTENDKELRYVVTLDSILSGHEGWIYGVHWKPKKGNSSVNEVKMQLVSFSMDKTIVIWEPEEASGVWLDVARLGEVGGNTLGFRGGKFSPDGEYIIAYSYHGAFHVWRNEELSSSWKPEVMIGGHFDEVSDLQWDPRGIYLLSVSQDQTTRLHAPWVSCNEDGKVQVFWCELGRPQVHGYNLSCLAVISSTTFASGAEEKVVRTFLAPSNVLKNLESLTKVEIQKNIDGNSTISPFGASVPALGLSNKAVYNGEENNTDTKHPKNQYPEAYFSPLDLKQPPTEEDLVQNTLWPEAQKLYGHGYEIFSLAASPDGSILASACKATSVEHAAIILWSTETWRQIGKLVSHSLTVTDLRFSPDGEYLLSVSRDRDWTLFRKSKSETNETLYNLYAKTNGKKGVHTRIIWCCSWSHDSKFFCTGSRDSKAVVWTLTENFAEDLAKLSENVYSSLVIKDESITSCSFAPELIETSSNSKSYLVALGCETGLIFLYSWSPETQWSIMSMLHKSEAHSLTVKRLAFRPVRGKAGEEDDKENISFQLASAGSDNLVRIHTIYIN